MNSTLPTIREFFRALSIGHVERRLLLMSFVVGIVVWPVVFALKELVHLIFHEVVVWLEHGSTQLLIFIPLLIGSAFTAFIAWYRPSFVTYQAGDEEEELNAVAGDGVERTIALYRSSEAVLEREAIGHEGPIPRLRFPTFGLAARKFLATLTTLGGGASGGLEGSAALIGESMGAGVYSLIERWTGRRGDIRARFEDGVADEVRVRFVQTAQIAGVSAAVTVLIGAPLASAFFATEVMYRDRPLFEKLFYGLLASLAAYTVTVLAIGDPVLFHIHVVPEPAQGSRYLLYLILLAVVVTVVGQLYRVLSNASNHWFSRRFKNPYARHLAGGVIVGIIALTTLFVMEALGVSGHVLELVLGSGETAIVAGLDLAEVDELTAWVALIAL
ncbi:MAG: chloride channel protein, partial [Chloroflexota bacterium]